MKPSPICRICQQPEEEHHRFNPFVIPTGCICDPGTWLPKDPGEICAEYIGNGVQNCETCEHDKGCHGEFGEVAIKKV